MRMISVNLFTAVRCQGCLCLTSCVNPRGCVCAYFMNIKKVDIAFFLDIQGRFYVYIFLSENIRSFLLTLALLRVIQRDARRLQDTIFLVCRWFYILCAKAKGLVVGCNMNCECYEVLHRVAVCCFCFCFFPRTCIFSVTLECSWP